MSECRSCHAPVVWRTTQAGARIPIDPAPVPDGNIILLEGPDCHVMNAHEQWLRAQMPGGPGKLYVSHFATCPNARQHRRPK